MKCLVIITLLVLLFSETSLAQRDSSKVILKKGTAEYYQQKSRHSLNAAFILAGSGIVCTGAGLLMHTSSDDWSMLPAILILTGVSSMIVSVPYFVLHFVQKHKANILFKKQDVSLTTSKLNITQPSVCIQISL